MDIVVLAATRPSLPTELNNAPLPIQDFVRGEIRQILQTPVISAIPTHIHDREPLANDVEERVMAALRAIATPQ